MSWRGLGLIILMAGAGVPCGCGTASGPAATLTRTQFAALYDDRQNITDVYYMGTDAQYSYFCMEHWTFKPDGSDATLDSRKFYQVPVTEMGVKNPFIYTRNQDQWRLMRPRQLSDIKPS